VPQPRRVHDRAPGRLRRRQPAKPVSLEAGFAAYASQIQADGRTLVYRREYRLLDPLLPASRYDEALKFFLAVAAEEQQSLLLKSAGSRRP